MNKYKFIGIITAYFIKILIKTTRYEVVKSPEAEKYSQAIIVFWHRKIVPAMIATEYLGKKASIVSSSKDGDILEEVLKRFDNTIIRGSSSRDNIKSLKETLRMAKSGYTIGIAIDGPRGPIYEPKPGALYIAMKTGVPMIPVGGYTNKKWIFKKAWDKFELPKFFSKSCYYVGEPMYFNKESNEEESTRLIAEKLHEVNKTAKEIYESRKNKQ